MNNNFQRDLLGRLFKMETDNIDLKTNCTELSVLLTSLDSSLVNHTLCLEKCNTAIESLTRAIRQLDTTIKKISDADNPKISLQLRESLTTFAECYINPQYYHKSDYKMLVNASHIKNTKLTIDHFSDPTK
jgi:hypothetical protein